MAAVIEVEGLRKEYRRLRGEPIVAVDGLDLSVPEGGVYGFLGPNGSGKTTTIRCLLGLIRPSGGRCTLLGAPIPRHLPSVISKVGAIVETPALFPTFSGRRNLQLLGKQYGIGDAAVDAALERVGLAERAGSLVKTYSLGMRQRLGLASALLKDPALLVLDEPANGLDPAGIREIRELMRSLADEGRTVFVSSHLLSEIQQTCDAMAILTRGKLVTSGSVQDVLAQASTDRGLVVRVADIAAGVSILREAGVDASADHHGTIVARIDPTEGARVSRALGERGMWVTELRPFEASLEDVFLELTGDTGEQALPPPPPPSAGPPPSDAAPGGGR